MTRRITVLLALAACALLCPAQGQKPDNSTATTPAAGSAQAATAHSGSGANDNYVIGSSDVLNVTVW